MLIYYSIFILLFSLSLQANNFCNKFFNYNNIFPVTGSLTVNGHPLSANLSTNPNVNPPGSLQSIYAQMAQTPQINTQFLLLSTTLSLPQTQTQLRLPS